MSITFSLQPCALLEATELLFFYFNELPVQRLSGTGPFCVPEEAAARMMQEACGGLDRSDEALSFFFQGFKLPAANDELSCLARFLVFTFADWPHAAPEDAAQSMLESWRRLNETSFVFTDVNAFSLSNEPWRGDGPAPFANGLGRLSMPIALRERLLETLSAFQEHHSALMRILLPIAQYLQEALQPYADRAAEARQTWLSRMEADTPNAFLETWLRIRLSWELQDIWSGVLFFIPDWVLPRLNEETHTLHLLFGAGKLQARHRPAEFDSWEYTALRLLGSPARMKMLKALRDMPMTSREMAQSLQMHLGAVSRDVDNMRAAGLLNLELNSDRRRYSVNYAAVRTLAGHLLDLCPEETDGEKN